MPDLTPRERQVLALVAEALPNKEIAAALGIAYATVNVHVRSFRRKLGARNRTAVALWAVRNAAPAPCTPAGTEAPDA